MKQKPGTREIKYPENLKINNQLQNGDRLLIAKKSNLKPGTIRDMLNGYRRITDDVARAIIELMSERNELNRLLGEIANQSLSHST
ncbi:MAG: hypothetical protein WC865_13525 [Bacteroidales bacterium]